MYLEVDQNKHILVLIWLNDLQMMLHTVVHVFELQNFDGMKYGINLMK